MNDPTCNQKESSRQPTIYRAVKSTDTFPSEELLAVDAWQSTHMYVCRVPIR